MTKQDGKRRSAMASQDARPTLLRLIEEHQGEWGWYQFERAFPPGWFTDEPPTVRAKDILDRLEADGLVTTTPGEPQQRYRLTDRGMHLLREAAVGSASD
jgi:DNA-binding PadR family transcriptional regulator